MILVSHTSDGWMDGLSLGIQKEVVKAVILLMKKKKKKKIRFRFRGFAFGLVR
jgi:hypothetical protein